MSLSVIVKVRRLFINNRFFCFWVCWFENVILNNFYPFTLMIQCSIWSEITCFHIQGLFLQFLRKSLPVQNSREFFILHHLSFPLYCPQLFQPLQLPSSPSHSFPHHHRRPHLLPLFLFLFKLVAKSLRPDCDKIWEKSVRAPTKAGNSYNFHFMYVIFKIFWSYWRRYQFEFILHVSFEN